MANAKRRTSSKARKTGGGGRPGGPGGKRRDGWAIEDITDIVAIMLDDGLGRRQIAVALGRWLHEKQMQPDETPMPEKTVDDYIRRAKDARADALKESRTQAAETAVRRLKRLVVRARGARKMADEVRAENLLAEIQGTKAVRKVALTNPAGDRPLELKMPKTTPTSDDLRRELAGLLEKTKGGTQLARALADVD